MKDIKLLILIAGLLISCKENPEVSKNEVVENDSISLKKMKIPRLDIDAIQASPANFKILLDNENYF